jgi:sugar lactone lactonase YvrE
MDSDLLDSNFTLVSGIRHGVGECPTWDDRLGRLLWTSILDGEIHSLSISTGEKAVWQFGESVGSFGLCRSGRLVVGLRERILYFDPVTQQIEPLARVSHALSPMRLNDGKVGPDGAFWVGSMDERPEKEPVGRLYRVSPDGDVRVIADGILVSNGLAWSPDGRTMYHSDSSGRWIDAWAFDPATGTATERHKFADLDEETGTPDGGACDIHGCYWSAGTSAGRINRFAPDGSLVHTFTVPNLRPTMPCFGGYDMKTLFITSHSLRIPPEMLERFTLCGTVLSTRVDVSGLPSGRMADQAQSS